MNTRDVHVAKMETRLRHWGSTLDRLIARVAAAGADARAEELSRIAELRRRHWEAQVKVAELKAAGDETWSASKAGVDGAWRDLKAALRMPAG
jgi:hypothetical protein